jgi:hypothetical protein
VTDILKGYFNTRQNRGYKTISDHILDTNIGEYLTYIHFWATVRACEFVNGTRGPQNLLEYHLCVDRKIGEMARAPIGVARSY